jgi:predicted transcriptional regulator
MKRDYLGSVSGGVAFNPDISTPAKAVYLVLVMYRNDKTHECWPSNATVAKGVGCSERTVIRALVELAEKGVISREARFVEGRQTTSITHLTDVVSTVRGVQE